MVKRPKPSWPRLAECSPRFRDVSLRDGRRDEERSPDERLTVEERRIHLRLVLLAGAAVVVVVALHFLAPAPLVPPAAARMSQAAPTTSGPTAGR